MIHVSCPAYVLHRRPYQNTGLIVHFLTLEHGLVHAVAKGAQRVSRGKRRYALDFFQALNIECRGKGDLLSLSCSESVSLPMSLSGKKLFCALYVNELLTRLLPRHEEVAVIYGLYQAVIHHINACECMADVEWSLRKFEWALLNELGYGIPFCEADTGEVLVANQTYAYKADVGFVRALNPSTHMTGERLTALSVLLSETPEHDVVLTEQHRAMAKQLLRHVMSSVLGNTPLKSRELFT